MNITLADIILFIIIILFFFLSKYLIPIKINKNLAETESRLSEELAKIKSSLSKEQYIHRLQFDKEFNIYSELWSNLIILKNSVELSILHEGFKNSGVNKKEIEGQILIKLMDNINNAKGTIENNRPFYSEEIYENALKIVELTKTVFGHPIIREENFMKHLSKLMESKDQIYEIISDIEQAIRERIRNIGEAKLIG